MKAILFLAVTLTLSLAHADGTGAVNWIQGDITDYGWDCNSSNNNNFIFMEVSDSPNSPTKVFFPKSWTTTLSIALTALSTGANVFWEAKTTEGCGGTGYYELKRLKLIR